MKLRKLVALITAGALCLGMSMTAFAADNSINEVPKPTPGNNANQPVAGDGFTKDGTTIKSQTLESALKNGDLTQEQFDAVVEVVSSPEKIKDVISEEFNLPKDAEVTLLGVMDYDPETAIVKGSTVSFALDQNVVKGLNDGDPIMVLHYNTTTGTWEVRQGKVNVIKGNVYVDVEMDSFSPVAFVKVMSDGKVYKADPVTKKPISTTATPTKASPKTGE